MIPFNDVTMWVDDCFFSVCSFLSLLRDDYRFRLRDNCRGTARVDVVTVV